MSCFVHFIIRYHRPAWAAIKWYPTPLFRPGPILEHFAILKDRIAATANAIVELAPNRNAPLLGGVSSQPRQ